MKERKPKYPHCVHESDGSAVDSSTAAKVVFRITAELHMMMERRNPEDVVSIEDVVRERTICEAIRRINTISVDDIV